MEMINEKEDNFFERIEQEEFVNDKLKSVINDLRILFDDKEVMAILVDEASKLSLKRYGYKPYRVEDEMKELVHSSFIKMGMYD